MKEIKSAWLAELVQNVGTHAETSNFSLSLSLRKHTRAHKHMRACACIRSGSGGDSNPDCEAEGVTCVPASLGRLP